MSCLRTVLVSALVSAGMFFSLSVSVGAVTGSTAMWRAGNAQAHLCGRGTWWRCADAWAPKASCYGRGRGVWECYGGITEQGDPAFWKWRNCRFYFWISRWGEEVARRNC